MSAKEYSFADKFLGAEFDDTLVRKALAVCFPMATMIHKGNIGQDFAGADYAVEMPHHGSVMVDVKIRDVDWAAKDQDDLALEIWSVEEKRVVGWTLDENKITDYVLWVWKDTRRYCILPFPLLLTVTKENLDTWKKRFRTARQVTPGRSGREPYHSLCIFVPRSEIHRAIQGRFM